MAPVASAKRLTTLVIATRPTFWLKEVLGSTPNSAAKLEPRPSQVTPPDSSLSVASRPRPPSITPEISPTVSTAVTKNIISTGTMARMSNTGFTGISLGISNQGASATFCQFKTQALVYSAPSAVTPVVGSTSPMIMAAIYPQIIPSKMEEELSTPFVPCLKSKITIRTNRARQRFSTEPKSLALLPPPKVLIPTEIRLKPMDKTTVPVTTAGENLRRGFRKNPNTVSIRPPRMEAPIMAPYAMTPPPILDATLLNTPIKPEDVPMIRGTLPPIGPMAKSCTKVTSPATNMAFWRRLNCREANSPPAMPQAPVMISSGVRLPTNMASTCCSPKGIAWRRGILPSSLKAASESCKLFFIGESFLMYGFIYDCSILTNLFILHTN